METNLKTNSMKEFWKEIEGYKDYQVSNFGRIKNLNYKGLYKERLLKGSINTDGYITVGLYNNGIAKTYKVHQLVSIAFLNHSPCGHKLVVNHKNFIKSDNRVENLEIVTSRENGNKKHIKSSSKYVGVSWVKRDKKWKAAIVINKVAKYIGLYNTEIEAHNAYQNILKELTKEHSSYETN